MLAADGAGETRVNRVSDDHALLRFRVWLWVGAKHN